MRPTNLLEIESGGAEGSRTPDLLIANETLYQLSYDPTQKFILSQNRDRTRPIPGKFGPLIGIKIAC